MKKVRKCDLQDLITAFYCKFIANISIDEYYSLPCREQIKVNIRSTHILVWWNYDEDLEIETDTKNFVEDFARKIEETTFGNLKVTYCSTGTRGNNTTFEIYIANAYEVLD